MRAFFLKKNLSGLKEIENEKKGFTLIELLVVIAVVGVLAAALLTILNPLDKMKQGNDTKVIGDVRVIHDAANRYYTQEYVLPGTNAVPATTDWVVDIENSKELRKIPKPPNFMGGSYGSSYGYAASNGSGSLVVWGIVLGKNNREKASAADSDTAYFVISSDKSCFTTTVPDQSFKCL